MLRSCDGVHAEYSSGITAFGEHWLKGSLVVMGARGVKRHCS